jgi:hypothetical protein
MGKEDFLGRKVGKGTPGKGIYAEVYKKVHIWGLRT